jgi:ketosteroid isomerase-like protein
VTSDPVTLEQLDSQEATMAAAFADGDAYQTRALYDPDVVYLSPTARLYGWPARIEGVERTLEFIALTISAVSDIAYAVDERALIAGRGAYVRVHFDFTMDGARLRSIYVVVYRYRAGRIVQQELYYDPSAALGPPPARAGG